MKSLMVACRIGDLDTVKQELSSKSVNQRDANQWTLLHWAAMGGHLNIVEALVEEGALVNALNDDGCTPLFYSCEKGFDSVSKWLVGEAGAQVNVQDTLHGQTALHRICYDRDTKREQYSSELLQWMIEEAGADATIVDNYGNRVEDMCTGRAPTTQISALIQRLREARATKESETKEPEQAANLTEEDPSLLLLHHRRGSSKRSYDPTKRSSSLFGVAVEDLAIEDQVAVPVAAARHDRRPSSSVSASLSSPVIPAEAVAETSPIEGVEGVAETSTIEGVENVAETSAPSDLPASSVDQSPSDSLREGMSLELDVEVPCSPGALTKSSFFALTTKTPGVGDKPTAFCFDAEGSAGEKPSSLEMSAEDSGNVTAPVTQDEEEEELDISAQRPCTPRADGSQGCFRREELENLSKASTKPQDVADKITSSPQVETVPATPVLEEDHKVAPVGLAAPAAQPIGCSCTIS
jgi:hypothetical protein